MNMNSHTKVIKMLENSWNQFSTLSLVDLKKCRRFRVVNMKRPPTCKNM